MKKIVSLILLSVAAILSLFGGLVWHTANYRPLTLYLFYEKIFWENVLDDPETLSSIRILDRWGIRGHNSEWTDSSPERELEIADRKKRQLEILRSYDSRELKGEDKAYYRALEWGLELAAKGEAFVYYDYPVNQLFGLQNQIPSFLATVHGIEDENDVEAYIARLRKIPNKIDQSLRGLRLRQSKGIIPPIFILDKVLDEIKGFRRSAPRTNILYVSLEKKLTKIEGLKSRKNEYLEKVENEIRQSVYPSYEKLEEFLSQQKKATDHKAGVWKLPDGDDYYAQVLKFHTTTSLSPEEIHSIGISEVKRIQAEMKDILKSIGLTNREIPVALKELRSRPEFLFPSSDQGRDEALSAYREILQDSILKSKPLFPIWPKANIEVQRIPAFKEAGAPGAYYEEPSWDGKRPGVFYANLRDLKEVPKFGMRTLTYHETIPGHHLQIAWAQELTNAPRILRMTHYTAFVEGWALYAERLAKDYAFFSDPYSDLGRLQAELFRAVRLVVDTGIHRKRWSREQAIEYMSKNTGMPPKDVTAEIERYIVYPGQACAYKIGMLSFLRLREDWKTAKGDAFDIKDFHGFALGAGSLPMEILEERSKETLLSSKN
ncbi:PF05960 family protein [Leptospira inadai serovar Lyme str. 10]|uniref:PF05960 family protein n=2 Tax=Leptospira inadai serovar Lyme TaxID=293084 RepID=V6HGS7_9LEPT|nr:DUF885 domain-containing protein [Leptospira inadai]EQA34820.1 PF05960 family protein [Leptospira inadai serovar Lyme str. 10]PNV76077.1 DUF885 domain-containing protein [Leptospira inadai serovar Lyme]